MATAKAPKPIKPLDGFIDILNADVIARVTAVQTAMAVNKSTPNVVLRQWILLFWRKDQRLRSIVKGADSAGCNVLADTV